MTIAFTASAFVYYQMVINIGNLGGNTFVTMFLMGLVEGPGCVGAVLLADKFGRRWTHFGMLATNAVLFFIVMWIAYMPSLNKLVIFFCMWIKLNISGTFVVSYLQVNFKTFYLNIFGGFFLFFLAIFVIIHLGYCKKP